MVTLCTILEADLKTQKDRNKGICKKITYMENRRLFVWLNGSFTAHQRYLAINAMYTSLRDSILKPSLAQLLKVKY